MHVFFILLLVLLLGFKPVIYEHGYSSLDIKSWDRIEQKDNQDKVFNVLGSPTLISKNGDKIWYYVSNEIKQYRFFQKKRYSSQSLKISFNDNNIVSDISYIDVPEKRIININKRSTPIVGINNSFVHKVVSKATKH